MEDDHNLTEWLSNPLRESLETLFLDLDSNLEKRSTINEYQETPVKDETRLYRGARKSKITPKLKELLLLDQQSMTNLQEDDDNKFVPFLTSDPREYHLNSNLPTPIRELLTYYYWRVRIPPDSPCQIKVGLFGRQGKMVIKPPTDEKVVCRVVIHLGPEEVYQLTEVNKSGKLGFSKQRVISNGSYMVLNRECLLEHNIFVSPNPRVKFPLPENCEEMIQQGLSAVGSGNQYGKKTKMPNSNQIKKMMNKTIVRLRTYRRLTVVLDFGPSSLVEDDKMVKIANFGDGAGPPPPGREKGDKMEWPEKLPSTIPANIAKSLPPGIDPSIIGRISGDKQLAGKVNSIAKGVASDLEGREELNSEQPMITKDLVSAIATSAVKRISRDKVVKLSDNIEAVVSETNPNLINGSSRKARRRKARKDRRNRNRNRGKVDSPTLTNLDDPSLTLDSGDSITEPGGKSEQETLDRDDLLSRMSKDKEKSDQD